MKNKRLNKYVFYVLLTVGGFTAGNLTKQPLIITEEKIVVADYGYICKKRNNGEYATVVYHDVSKYNDGDYTGRIIRPVTVYHYNDTIYIDTIFYEEYKRTSAVDWCLMDELRQQ